MPSGNMLSMPTSSPLPSVPRCGLLFAGSPSVAEMVDVSRRAESVGFESVWVAETRLTRDGFVPAAAIAQATEHIRVGTGIVNVYTRNPVLLALSFIGLEEIAPGRILMGVTRMRSPSAWRRPPTSGTTSPTRASSVGGSVAW